MHKRPEIVALLLNYRNAALTVRCLRSLVGQGLARVLLVDNSADATQLQAMREALDGLLPLLDYPLTVLATPANLGFGRGVNWGLSQLSQPYDYLLLINNDAIAEPGMVSALTGVMHSPDVFLATPSAAEGGQGMLHYQRWLGLLTATPLPGSFPFPVGAALLCRLPWPWAGPLFDEDFFMYGEDVALGWAIRQHGGRCVSVHEARLQHEPGQSSRRNPLFYEFHVLRGHWLLCKKTATTRAQAALLHLTKAPLLLSRALFRALSQRSWVPLQALWRVLRQDTTLLPDAQ